MKSLRFLLPAALAVLALLAPSARADLRRYQCNVSLARETVLLGFTIPFDRWDDVIQPTFPEKMNYLFEFVIDDSVQDTDASTTKGTFPGALVSGAFFGPVTSQGVLTTSTTATHFILTGAANIEIDAGQATITAAFADPKAQAEVTIPFVGVQTLPMETLKLTNLPVTTNDTGAGQSFKQQATAALAWSDLTFVFGAGGNDIGAGAVGTAGSNDIRFFTLVETTAGGDGVLASRKAGIGSPVSGEPTGTTFAAFGVPSINASGRLAATATLLKAKVKTAAIVSGAGISPAVKVRAGDAAPGVTGGVFKKFGPVLLDDAGNIAFLGTLKAGPGGVKSANDLGLWSDRSGALSLLAREGDPAPGGIANATVAGLTDVVLDDNGVVFAGKVKGTGISGASDGVVWVTRTAGTFVLLRDGDTVPISGGGTKIIQSMIPLRASPGAPGQGTAGLSSATFTGIECLVKYTDGTSGLVLAKRTDAALTVTGQVVTGVDAPGLSAGNKLTKLSVPTQAPGTDRFAFRGTVEGKTEVLFGFFTGNQSFSEAARIGTEVTEPGGFTVTKLGDPAVADDGVVAWIGRIAGPASNTSNDGALTYLPFNGEVKTAIREGDAGPGITDSKIKAFTGFALAQGASNRFYFSGQLVVGPGSVTKKNDTALWGGTPGAFTLLLREGDVLDLNDASHTVKSFTVFPRVPGSEIQRRAHAQKHIVVQVTCTDGTSALVPLLLP